MASSIVELDLYVDVAEDGDVVVYDEEGSDEESDSEDEEEDGDEDEEEDGDEDYVPPGPDSVQPGAVNASDRPPIVASDAGDTLAGVVQAGGASHRAGGEALDAAEEPENERRCAGTGGGEEVEEDAEESSVGRSVRGDMDMSTSNCPICMERWTCQGVHRVCCIPCGHVYGRSCLENWFRRCGNTFAKCPQCKRRFKVKDIINLYAPQITVVNDDLEKEVSVLREKNEVLSMERKKLLGEVRKLKDAIGEDDLTKLKKPCLRQVFPAMAYVRSSNFIPDLQICPGQAFSGLSFTTQHSGRGTSFSSAFVLQAEPELDGARVLDIGSSSQNFLISGKSSGCRGGHILTKISFLCPHARQNVQLPDDTGTVRDLHFAPANTVLPGRLALLASLGKKLSVFSMESNNVVLKYNLPGPSWSCSWDADAPYHIYAGLQDGTLLMFDVRQTAKPLESRAGLSRHPVHTIHSLASNELHSGRTLLTASSVGVCLWDVGDNETSPVLVPESDNQGVCISLACSSSVGDIVASFRPKVEMNGDAAGSQPSQSPSPAVTGSGRLGTHVLLKRVYGNIFRKHDVAFGNVSELRMSRSAIIPAGGGNPLFVYGDEAFHGLCIWDLTSFQVIHRLKPHEHPIFDIKYTNSNGRGILGCVSENRLQFFMHSES